MAAQGSESEQTGKAIQKKLAPGDKQGTAAVLQNHFRIYFPSYDTVAKSKGGIGVSHPSSSENQYRISAVSFVGPSKLPTDLGFLCRQAVQFV